MYGVKDFEITFYIWHEKVHKSTSPKIKLFHLIIIKNVITKEFLSINFLLGSLKVLISLFNHSISEFTI